MYMCPYIQHVWNSCSGNPAAVCLLEEDVPDQLKQAHYQTVFTKSLNSENLMMVNTKEIKRNERHYWQALATEMNISETCFLTLRPGATRGHLSPHAMCSPVFFIVLGISAHPLLDYLLVSAHPMSLTTIFSRLRGGIPLWPQMVHPDQWSEQHREQKERQAQEKTVQMSDFIQSMLNMSHEASVTIGVGLCQVNPIRICQ